MPATCFPDSVIKIGFRHSRHLSAYQFDFLHMMAPYLDMEVNTPGSRFENATES